MSSSAAASRLANSSVITAPGSLTPADILAPHRGVTLLEFPHDGLAALVVDQHDRYSLPPEELQVSGKGGGLADNHPRYLEQQDRPAAHLARGERGVERRAEVGGLPSGVAQAGHLAVGDRVSRLNPFVVPGRDQAPSRGQRRTYWDAADGEACPGLGQRHVHHCLIDLGWRLRFHRQLLVAPCRRAVESRLAAFRGLRHVPRVRSSRSRHPGGAAPVTARQLPPPMPSAVSTTRTRVETANVPCAKTMTSGKFPSAGISWTGNISSCGPPAATGVR